MSAQILAIQFRENINSIAGEQKSIVREIGENAEVTFISALNEALAWENPQAMLENYHGVILGGSGEFDFDGNRADTDPAKTMSQVFLQRLQPLFMYIFEHDIPTLGICYGHQIIGAFAGAMVRCDTTQKKTCSHQVQLMVNKNDYFLFSDLPETFFAHYGHKDALDRVPEGAVLLMNGGDTCRVSALKYKNNIYTTQFHPELTYADMVERIKSSAGYLPEGAAVEEVFKDDPHSNTILRNFGRFVALAQ